MITVSLNEIRAQSPCDGGWKKVLKSKGGKSADMDAQFPLTDILESNDLDDALWCFRCRPEYSNLWRKFAVWAARQVENKMTDERSKNALDVAWKHSNGEASDEELRAARSAAWDAASAAWAAAWAAWAADWAAASDAASAAASAARAAAWAAMAADWAADWAAAMAARAAAWAAARDAQKAKLIEILVAGEWV